MSRIPDEFMVRYLDERYDYKKLGSTSCKKWSRSIYNQLRKDLEEVDELLLGDSFLEVRPQCIAVDLHFNNNSKCTILFVPRNISTYDLHTEIRDSFEISTSKTISFNILGMNSEHQRSLVKSMSSLTLLSQWKEPIYGKKFERLKKIKKPKKNYGFYSDLSKEEIDKLIKWGETIAIGTNMVRTLAMTPTNMMGSKELINYALSISKKNKTTSLYLNESDLEQIGAGCFLSVIRGTKGSEGGIVKLSYENKEASQTIAIIGKGVVFDTGGYDIKTDGGMRGMHRDMTGAAVALALFDAIVKSQLKVNVNLYMAVGENLISEKSYKSNEVVFALDGTSVEVSNTDAEGRMMLVDTILIAKKDPNDLIIDFATLTGAAVYSTDTRYSCVFSNNPDLATMAVEAGRECGERVWAYPSGDDFFDYIKSSVADVAQCVDPDVTNNAEHIYAATFLRYFVGEDVPWLHVDLSSEICKGGLGLVESEVTGFGVRWGFDFINKYLDHNYNS